MSDHSLMNPGFLKQELDDSTEIYAQAQTFIRELEIDIDRLTQHLIDAPRGYSDSVTLTADQAREIAEFLGKIQVYKFRMTSGREVQIRQYKQLLKDRRYRITTKILNLFKK